MQTKMIFLRQVLVGVLLLLWLTWISKAASFSGQIRSVAISPDGENVAFELKEGGSSFIYKTAIDNGAATRLTDAKDGEESSPTFSPDGKKIAFSYLPADHTRSRIVIVRVDGSDRIQWPSAVNEFAAVFSPDGKSIVFSRFGYYGAASPIAQAHPHSWDFFAIDLDGTNLRQLTNESFYMASPASISPDGKSMVIVAEGLNSGRQICVYSLERTGPPIESLRPHVSREADHKNPILNDSNFMPDGTSILFLAASNGKYGYDYDVYRIDLNTRSIEKLTNGNGYATNLRVSMDGRKTVFLKWRLDKRATPVESEIEVLDIETRKMRSIRITSLD